MKKILKFEVEQGGTLSCEECPFGVKCWDEAYWGWEYKCNAETNPFNCGKYNLTTLKLIGEE